MKDERGQVGGIEAVIFGTLVFVIGTLVVANAWGVIDAKHAATSAAREAGRAFVESPDPASAAANAVRAGEASLAGTGRTGSNVEVELESGTFRRCERVAFRVTVKVPMLVLPVLARHGPAFSAIGRHAELVDPHRDGVPGGAACAQG